MLHCVNNADYIRSNHYIVVNNELERMWKEAAMAYLKILTRHLPGLTEELHENYQSELPVSWPRFEPHTSELEPK
jgi:hypothetical protein